MTITILDELKTFITPLSGEEKFTLKQSLLEEGCRDPLILWAKENGEKILIDGHNRYAICMELGLSYETKELIVSFYQFQAKEAVHTCPYSPGAV